MAFQKLKLHPVVFGHRNHAGFVGIRTMGHVLSQVPGRLFADRNFMVGTVLKERHENGKGGNIVVDVPKPNMEVHTSILGPTPIMSNECQ